MIPSTEPFCGMSMLVLACHRECSPSSANSTTACKHACGWIMENARISSTWGKVSGKDACSPLLFNMFFTAVLRVAEKRFLVDAAITDNMVQPTKEGEGREEGHFTHRQVDGRRGEEEEV